MGSSGGKKQRTKTCLAGQCRVQKQYGGPRGRLRHGGFQFFLESIFYGYRRDGVFAVLLLLLPCFRKEPNRLCVHNRVSTKQPMTVDGFLVGDVGLFFVVCEF